MKSPNHVNVLDEFRTWLLSFNRQATVHNRIYYCSRFLSWTEEQHTNPWTVDTQDLCRWLTGVGTAPATRHNAAGALRSFYRWARMTRQCRNDPTAELPAITVPRGTPRPTPVQVLDQALFRTQSHTDLLMLLLASFAGLRVSEIAPLHTRDTFNRQLHIRGKGGRERDIPLNPVLDEVMGLFPAGHFFPSDKNPTGYYRPASIGQRIGDLLGPGWSAHTLRHKFATDFFETCPDILTLRGLLGHSRVDTTMIYTRPPARHLDHIAQLPTPGGLTDVRRRLRANSA